MGGVESTVHEQDFINFNGSSLFETYRALWTVAQEYDQNITASELATLNNFNVLTTFPFKRVAKLFTDSLRKMVRFQLRFLFLPYTLKQSDAIERLMTIYPMDDIAKPKIEYIFGLTDKLDKLQTSGILDSEGVAIRQPVEKLITDLCEATFELDVDYLWIVYNRVHHTLTITQGYHPYSKSELTLGYLNKYNENNPNRPTNFEQQLVEDITQLSLLSFPHPEAVIALERAQSILGMYYTETEASKLFIDNVDYKVKRYLAKAYETLGERLINRFKNNQVVQEETTLELPTDSVEKRYEKLLDAYNRYQTTGKGLYDLLSLTDELSKLPYNEVVHLPGFDRYIRLIKNINPFSTLDKDTDK